MDKTYDMTKDQAIKLDKMVASPYYIDFDDDAYDYYVFGVESGFAYCSASKHDDDGTVAAMNEEHNKRYVYEISHQITMDEGRE